MNLFNKKIDKENSGQTLILTARQTSLVVAGLILLLFFVFITGYFYGQKKAAEQFSYRIDQESLADQIYSSMCGLYDTESESSDESEAADKR